MPTDAHFLAAVAANPADRLPRLVYADWLDEQNDLRGELIRLEEETRERVAWDDVLWKLKPRRSELRQQAGADWLKAMGYAQNCEPLFRGQPFPDNPRDAWRLIREAVTRWSHYDTGWDMPYGTWEPEVAEVERRLGLTLPPAVREFIAFAHDFKDPATPDVIDLYGDQFEVEPVEGVDAISLLVDGGESVFGVLTQDLHLADPPVQVIARNYGPADGGGWEVRPQRWLRTVTEFAFLYCYGQAAHDFGRWQAQVMDPAPVRRRLAAEFTHHTAFGRCEYFERPNAFALLEQTAPGAQHWLTVSFARPTSEPELPACVLEWCRAGNGWGSGFLGDLQRRFINEYRAARGEPPLEEDDIPF